jgi:lysozyme
MNYDFLKKLLILDEGKRQFPYFDSLGILTAGVGRNLKAVGLRDTEIDLMLTNDIMEAVTTCKRLFPNFELLDEVRKTALLDMAFNLGYTRMSGFANTIGFINRGDFTQAASNMLVSRWATQVGKRANRLAEMMHSGKYPTI